MVGFSSLNEEAHSLANNYIDKFPILFEIWTTQEILKIKYIFNLALDEALFEDEEELEEVRELVNLWDWKEIPEDLDGDLKYYIFEALLLRVRPREQSNLARIYVEQNYEWIKNQYYRDDEAILFLDRELPYGLTAKRIEHTFRNIEKEKLKNYAEQSGLTEEWRQNRRSRRRREKINSNSMVQSELE